MLTLKVKGLQSRTGGFNVSLNEYLKAINSFAMHILHFDKNELQLHCGDPGRAT